MARRHVHRGDGRKLEGNLCDLCVHRLVEICRHHRVTGMLRINTWGHSAIVQFEQGRIEAARFRALDGERAMSELFALRDGMFELVSAAAISLDAPMEAARRPARGDSPVVLGHEPAAPMTPAPMTPAPMTPAPMSQPAWPQPAWPQPHVAAGQAHAWMRRLPPLGPALGFGLLGFMLLIMVAIQL